MRGGQEGGMRGGAVKLLTFHGRKWLRKRPQGAEVSLKDELSLTHTCSFPHILSPSACFVSLSLSHTHLVVPSLSILASSLLLFYFLLCHHERRPLLLQPGGAYISQRALLLGLWGGVALLPKVLSSFIFICLISEGTNVRLPEKREMDHPPSVCVCVCV